MNLKLLVFAGCRTTCKTSNFQFISLVIIVCPIQWGNSQMQRLDQRGGDKNPAPGRLAVGLNAGLENQLVRICIDPVEQLCAGHPAGDRVRKVNKIREGAIGLERLV